MRIKLIDRPKVRSKDIDRLIQIAMFGPIVWHSTTPKCFECEAGCENCCGPTYYFGDERSFLPKKIRDRLVAVRSTWVPDRSSGGCCFHKVGSFGVLEHGCGVFEHVPLRCRLYPYWPIIVRGEIVIMAEPLCDVFRAREPDSLEICYGLGAGFDVTRRVEILSREFLVSMAIGAPDLLVGSVFRRAEDLLSDVLIDHHTHRIYQTHREAYPHIIERVLRDRFSHRHE